MKTIGLLGGMSWESTVPYYRQINEAVKARLGGLHSARIVLYSVDFAEIERLQRDGDWDAAGVLLAAAAQALALGRHMGGDADDQMLRRSDVQAFLAAEIVGDGLEVDAGRLGQPPRGGAVVALAAEHVDGGIQQLLAGDVAAIRWGFGWRRWVDLAVHGGVIDHTNE